MRQPRFSSRDPLLDGGASATLDLHGMTREAARQAVSRFLRVPGRSGAVVHIITGRGRGSPGAPALRPLVSTMLKGELAPLVRDWSLDASDGGYRVLVR